MRRGVFDQYRITWDLTPPLTKSRNHNFVLQMKALIKLSNCKQEIKYHSNLFLERQQWLSRSAWSAPPSSADRLHPTCGGAADTPYFPSYFSISSRNLFHPDSFLPSLRAFSWPPSTHVALFCQTRRRVLKTLRTRRL